MRKGLFGYFWTCKHKRLAGNLGFDEFVGRAIHVVTSTKLDRYVLGALGLSWSDLDLDDGQDCNIPWVAVAKKLCGGGDDIDWDDMLQSMLGYHQRVVTRMASHLRLTADNIRDRSGSAWLSAAILNKDPTKAQIGARIWREHLVRLRPSQVSPYEKIWLDDSHMMIQLGRLADRWEPCVVWRDNGAYNMMFTFLAARFLVSDDSVGDCERIHARWKWILGHRRALKFRARNAILRLTHYIEHNGALPPTQHLGRTLLTYRRACGRCWTIYVRMARSMSDCAWISSTRAASI